MQGAVEALVEPYVGTTGGLIKALHAVQERDGYIDAAAIPAIAETFNVTKAEVKGVVSFYEDFRRKPPGKHIVRLCSAEACQAVGARTLAETAEKTLGIKTGETTPCETVTLEHVACLGLCSVAPAVQIDGQLKAKVTGEDVAALLTSLLEGRAS